ncbi:hypothetical protein QTG56_11880 [Rossellomorea sp. AcN35-11]|nr:hypothetical protein [Rossellomorea aquimaris]WJV27880.1 hypothetical protein QTG56_11880 [Rossellomorea sp. AcN35-11]
MIELIFAAIAYLLLLPVLILIPMKLSFMNKVLLSSGAFFISIVCILASTVIPFLSVMIIFALILILSAYFLETRFRSFLLRSTESAENRLIPERDRPGQHGLKQAASGQIETAPPAELKGVSGYDVQRNSMDATGNLELGGYEEYSKEPSIPPYEEEEDVFDFENQLQEWDPPAKEKEPVQHDAIASSTLLSDEELEYNRLFFESRN